MAKTTKKPAATKTTTTVKATPQKPVNVTLNLTMPKAPAAPKQEAQTMAKRPRKYGPRNSRRRGQLRTAAETGSIGGKTYQKLGRMPKERPGAQIIVLKDDRTGRARPIAVGKRGGIYPQKKWDSVKSVVAALPGAALATVGVAYVGTQLKNNATVQGWSAKFPGGMTGLALAVGAGAGYVAYKNRHILGLLVGLSVAAWALIKLASQKLTGMEESTTPEGMTPDTTPLSLPSGEPGSNPDLVQQAMPGLGIEGKKHFQAGAVAQDAGNYDAAIVHYNNAWRASNDYTMSLYLANAYFDKALKEGAFKNTASGPKLNSDLLTARALYEQYLDKGTTTAEVDAEALAGAKEWAEGRIKHIDSMKATGKPSPIETSGAYVSGDDDEEVIEEIIEGEDDGFMGEDDEEVIEEYTEGDDDEGTYDEVIEEVEGDDEEVSVEEYVYATD